MCLVDPLVESRKNLRVIVKLSIWSILLHFIYESINRMNVSRGNCKENTKLSTSAIEGKWKTANEDKN